MLTVKETIKYAQCGAFTQDERASIDAIVYRMEDFASSNRSAQWGRRQYVRMGGTWYRRGTDKALREVTDAALSAALDAAAAASGEYPGSL
ncbi:hypothetical protein [Immundisolibacter sp.]|uniref:hypothetical protein n=1 Tax=Immundisolibacter sp. TaxID=1934948 RepID=UPI003F83D75D